jgi:hypothetical protein
LIPSACNYISKIPNPHQMEFVIIKSLSELMDPTDQPLSASSLGSPSLSSPQHFPEQTREGSDTVKLFAILILQIFHQCEAMSLLTSLQVTSRQPLDHPLPAFASSPHTILLSICDPTLTASYSDPHSVSFLYLDNSRRCDDQKIPSEEEEDEI